MYIYVICGPCGYNSNLGYLIKDLNQSDQGWFNFIFQQLRFNSRSKPCGSTIYRAFMPIIWLLILPFLFFFVFPIQVRGK
jgi:hypothetical protein